LEFSSSTYPLGRGLGRWKSLFNATWRDEIMAYNDLAQFLPQQGGFKQPGQFDRMLKAESLKKASYLSAMDQFYSQLEETMREFDLGLGQQKKEFSNLMDLRRDYRNIEYGKLGMQGLGIGLDAFLKNKDITYSFDWLDDWMSKLGYGADGGGGDFNFFDETDFDLGDYSNIFENVGGGDDLDFGLDLDFKF
jgi:hypothetical protein